MFVAFGHVKILNQVSGESLSKRFLKLQNFFEFLNLDYVDVTVGESLYVDRRFGENQTNLDRFRPI
jgi:hypothetical protein